MTKRAGDARATRGRRLGLPWPFVLVLLGTLAVSGCSDAPVRDNPIDPGSDAYRAEGTLSVLVQTRAQNPLEGAILRVENASLSAITNAEGMAQVTLPLGVYTYSASLDGFHSAVGTSQIRFQEVASKILELNGLPEIDSVRFTTSMVQDEAVELPRFQFYYHVQVKTSDPDGLGDIDHVSLVEPDGTDFLLRSSVSKPGWYNNNFDPEYSLGYDVEVLSGLVNQPMHVAVYDERGDSTTADQGITSFFYYKDLYEDMVKPGPSSSINPTFEWMNARKNPNGSPIWFNEARYRLEVFRANEPTALIDTTALFALVDTSASGGVNLDTLRLTWPGTLTPLGAEFKWKLSMYDPFGNNVTCRTSTFTPQ